MKTLRSAYVYAYASSRVRSSGSRESWRAFLSCQTSPTTASSRCFEISPASRGTVAAEKNTMTEAQRLQAIHDLASARLRNGPHEANVEHDLKEIVKLATPEKWLPYPPGMQAESQRMHREYNALVAAQAQGAKNGADVVRLTDECASKGIVLVPGGENL